jgi:molybdopterin molybdotransferase
MGVEEALERILAAIDGPLEAENVSIDDALGRVLAEPVVSTTDLPPWDNSAMDGYAIVAADVATATDAAPVRLRVQGEVRAGQAPDVRVEPGTAVRIATGAPVPPGADAVVPVEETTPLGDTGEALGPRGRDASGPLPAACAVHLAVGVGNAIRRRGSDLRGGTAVLAPGDAVGPSAIALAAGSGVGRVMVHRCPRVAILATGDEVRAPGQPLGPAGIPDANGAALRALVRTAGGEPFDLGIAPDRLDSVEGRLRNALATADAIVVSGGVSVGPYDVVRTAFASIGEIDLWRVAVQPGKPFAFGSAPAVRSGRPPTLLFGLPGNPVSSVVTFELFVRPALRRLAGRQGVGRSIDRAVLLEPVTKSHGRRAFLRVRVERQADGSPVRDGTGRVLARLAGGQGSHMISALAAADGLAVIPEEHDSLQAGAEVELWWLDRP